MLEPITGLIEVVVGFSTLCFPRPRRYLYYDRNPPPKIERLLDRAMAVFESGADVLTRLQGGVLF
jgi:hypothetical protein